VLTTVQFKVFEVVRWRIGRVRQLVFLRIWCCWMYGKSRVQNSWIHNMF